MPFTPFHLGPALLVGLLLFRYIDLAAILASSVAVDAEPLLILFFGLHLPLHGFFHSYLGATILAVPTAGAVYLLRRPTKEVLAGLGLGQESSFPRVLYTALLGVYSHVLLDSFLYGEMMPLYPLAGNPFVGLPGYGVVYEFCGLSFLLGLALFIYWRGFRARRPKRGT